MLDQWIGLYVARQIIEAHHGKIWAESDGLGKGSRFIVELKGK
ncbi:MAG: ATP-binding protein [Patescibacteria group bacterium]